MSARRKAALYGVLKTVTTPKQEYRHYKVDDLLLELIDAGVDTEELVRELDEADGTRVATNEEARLVHAEERAAGQVSNQPDPNEMPSQRLNTQGEDEIIRIDEQGRQWLQEEVRKPAYPKPRGRRVLTYMETGTQTQTVKNGEYVESFEVAGVGAGRPAEVKITLPSYQVGVYKDPRFPFKIHCYDGREGFDLMQVEEFYGGPELVPPMVKRVYIENVLCYDIRTVIRAINEEHRHLQLTGKA